MNIYYDSIAFYIQKAGGISVLFYEILKKVQSTENSIHVIKQDYLCENIFYEKLDFRYLDVITERKKPFKLNRYLNISCDINRPSILHSSYYRISRSPNVANVISLYDFNYERKYRKFFPRLIHSLQKKHAIKHADAIICIPESTRKDLIKFYPFVDHKKIRVVYLAGDSRFERSRVELTKKEKYRELEQGKYILFVGSRKNHKNFSVAVDAVAKSKHFKLAIVGGGILTEVEKQIIGKKLGSRFSHLEYVSVEDLNMLFNNAHCLLYPSSYEGFGIPILEAMQAGCPVITTNRASIPEVCGNAGIQVSKINSEEIYSEIIKLEDEEVRSCMIEEGLKQSQKFSWGATAENILSVYKEVLKEKFG